MSRLGKIKRKLTIDSMPEMERDFILFYDYILYLKEFGEPDEWLVYCGVYVQCQRMLIKHGIEIYEKPLKVNKKNFISKYTELDAIFHLDHFRDETFELSEIRFYNKKWRLDL